MMRPLAIVALLALVAGATACSVVARGERAETEARSPDQLTDFDALYRQNCAGCHGRDGRGGPAPAIGDPTYLALADDATIRRIATNGVSRTPMPAFAQSAGGLLTD